MALLELNMNRIKKSCTVCVGGGHFLLQGIKFHSLSESFQICFHDAEMKTFYTNCIQMWVSHQSISGLHPCLCQADTLK